MAGGVFGAGGLIVFFKGFASAPMSVVAPVAGLVSTVVPVAVGMADGERPSLLVLAGALLCLVAIVLVSAGTGGVGTSGALLRGVGYGIAAGAAFGVFYLCLKDAGHSAVLWPAMIQRLTGTVVTLGALAVTRTGRGGLDRRLALLACASGAVDAAARLVLQERMRTLQRIGLLLAAAGIVLVTA